MNVTGQLFSMQIPITPVIWRASPWPPFPYSDELDDFPSLP